MPAPGKGRTRNLLDFSPVVDSRSAVEQRNQTGRRRRIMPAAFRLDLAGPCLFRTVSKPSGGANLGAYARILVRAARSCGTILFEASLDQSSGGGGQVARSTPYQRTMPVGSPRPCPGRPGPRVAMKLLPFVLSLVAGSVDAISFLGPRRSLCRSYYRQRRHPGGAYLRPETRRRWHRCCLSPCSCWRCF